MIWRMVQASRARMRVAAVIGMVVGGLTACGALDVSDPTVVEESELANATGAEQMRGDALRRFYNAVARGALAGALRTDEYIFDPPSYYIYYNIYASEQRLDQRQSLEYEQFSGDDFGPWQEVRRATTFAIPKLRAYASAGAAEAHVAEMYAARGYATLREAEDICPGFPLHEVVGQTLVYGAPVTTDQAFERALADLDSAVTLAADSARVLDFARVARARALIGLGRFAEAAAAAQPVPTGYVFNADFNGTGFDANPLVVKWYDYYLVYGIGDHEGGAGLDFASANDPRLVTTPMGVANDSVTAMFAPVKYATADAPIVIANGVEARLIEAEADLYAGGTAWRDILNQLRADEVVPALSPLPDPGTPDARLDLLFRERAFWLFGTGHRLGDLRRLIRLYGRVPDTIFPTGAYRLGGTYSTATNIPFPAAAETPFNPAVTGCTER